MGEEGFVRLFLNEMGNLTGKNPNLYETLGELLHSYFVDPFHGHPRANSSHGSFMSRQHDLVHLQLLWQKPYTPTAT